MKSSSQFARSLFALLIATGLCASAYAQEPGKERAAPQVSSASAKTERLAVTAVDVEAHLKSRVVSSVTVGAPIEQVASNRVEVPSLALKTIVAAR